MHEVSTDSDIRYARGLPDICGHQGGLVDDNLLPQRTLSYLCIQGTVFDVSGNKAYGPGGSYKGMLRCHVRSSELTLDTVFAGKDASRALAQSSLKPEECRPEWEDLSDEHKKVLNDWFTFFSKRYNIKGKVASGSNL